MVNHDYNSNGVVVVENKYAKKRNKYSVSVWIGGTVVRGANSDDLGNVMKYADRQSIAFGNIPVFNYVASEE